MGEREPASALERLRALEQQAAASAAGAPARSQARKRGFIVSALLAVGLLLFKFKGAIFIFLSKGKLIFTALKLGKFAVTAWSMVLVALLYSRYYGAPFAIGLVLLTLIHELGHGEAARRVGIPVGAPVFIPFFGAMIALRARPRSTWEDFFIGAGGPIAGSAGGALCVAASLLTSGDTAGLLMAVGYFALVVNLFNLMPVWQLDGARMCAAVRLGDGVIGVAFLIAITIASAIAAQHLNPIALFVVALGIYRFAGAWWRGRPRRPSASALQRLSEAVAAATPQGPVTGGQHRVAALVYFGLAAALIMATHALQLQLPRIAL